MPTPFLLLGAFVLFSGMTASDASADTQSPEPVAIPMELLANRPVIRVTVNGQGPFPFLIGSEDQTTLIDRELADALKLQERRSAAAPSGMAVELGYGPARTVTVAVSVTDIARFMPEFTPAIRPRGIVSMSSWKGQLVTLDYTRWRVTLEPGALPEPNGKDVFALTESRQLRLPLSIAEYSVECRIDPLFAGGLLLPASYAAQTPIEGASPEWGAFNTREGTVRVKEAQLAMNVLLGPFELKAPLVLLAESGDIAVVGTPWLRRFSITYDLANARARVERLTTTTR